MISLRGHYSVDLLVGMLMAHYCYKISFKWQFHIISFITLGKIKVPHKAIECNPLLEDYSEKHKQ